MNNNFKEEFKMEERVKELEIKVKELENRIKFLYGMLEKQFEINSRVIDNIGHLQESMIQYSKATNENTAVLNTIGKIMKEES